MAAAPPGCVRVFYADCGSAAVEVALKLSFQARQQRGEPNRRRFATLHDGYHGETLGALALCGASAVSRHVRAPALLAAELPAPTFATTNAPTWRPTSGPTRRRPRPRAHCSRPTRTS